MVYNEYNITYTYMTTLAGTDSRYPASPENFHFLYGQSTSATYYL